MFGIKSTTGREFSIPHATERQTVTPHIVRRDLRLTPQGPSPESPALGGVRRAGGRPLWGGTQGHAMTVAPPPRAQKNKKIYDVKAQTQMWWLIAAAIIAILVVVLLVMWFRGTGGEAFDVINKQIVGLNDCDNDKAADSFDKCPCDASIQDEWPEELKEVKKCRTECSPSYEVQCKKKE